MFRPPIFRFRAWFFFFPIPLMKNLLKINPKVFSEKASLKGQKLAPPTGLNYSVRKYFQK